MKERYLVYFVIIFLSILLTSFKWPIKNGKITSTFGESRGDHFHDGVDMIVNDFNSYRKNNTDNNMKNVPMNIKTHHDARDMTFPSETPPNNRMSENTPKTSNKLSIIANMNDIIAANAYNLVAFILFYSLYEYEER